MDSQIENEELEIDWKCNSLWTVEYPKNDKLGKLLSHFSMIPVVAPFALLLVLVLKRNFASFRCLTGLIASTLVCRVLKSYFRHPRPDAGHSASHGKFGFPSDHSMSIAVLVVFVFHYSKKLDSICLRAIVNFSAAASSILVIVSRVYLQYHSLGQVLAGYVLGLLFAFAWLRATKPAKKHFESASKRIAQESNKFDELAFVRFFAGEEIKKNKKGEKKSS